MKIFLATSFSGKIDPTTGKVQPEYHTFITQVLESLRDEQAEVFCAMEHEGWKITKEPPELGVQKDLVEIDSADVMVALVPDELSAGVQFEIGYAVAKGKKVVLARQARDELTYYNQGVVSSGLVTLVAYDSLQSLESQLVIAFETPQV